MQCLARAKKLTPSAGLDPGKDQGELLCDRVAVFCCVSKLQM